MANIYRNDKVSLTNTDNTTLYTVPSNSRAIVKSLLVAEDNGGAAVVKATLTNAAGTGHQWPQIRWQDRQRLHNHPLWLIARTMKSL